MHFNFNTWRTAARVSSPLLVNAVRDPPFNKLPSTLGPYYKSYNGINPPLLDGVLRGVTPGYLA